MLLEKLWFSDFFLWKNLKERVYNPSAGMTDELKAAIELEMRTLSREMYRNVIDNFKQRTDVIISQNGRNI